MSKLVMGLDISTKTGLVILDSEGKCLCRKVLATGEYKRFARVQLIAKVVSAHVEEFKPDLVVVEGYAFGNKFTLVPLVEIGTAIRLGLLNAGHKSWLDVRPTTLKKWTTGKGNAIKADMAKHVKERWGFTSESDDVVDAYALSRLGLLFLSEGLQSCPKGTVVVTEQ